MPTLHYPEDSDRHRLSKPVGPTSRTRPSAVAAEVASAITPAASTGNTVEDHLEDIKTKLGSITDTEIFKGEYSNSTTYVIGDEVYWVDGSSAKRFFKRLTDGNDSSTGDPTTNSGNWDEIDLDVHNFPTRDQALADNDAALYRANNGSIYFNRRVISELRNAQTEDEVNTLLDTQLARLVTNSRWKGVWVQQAYAVNDYVVADADQSRVFRCIVARSSSDTSGPVGDTTGFTEVSGIEKLMAFRLRDITDLLDNKITLSPTSSNRGHWIRRDRDDEGYEIVSPPMVFENNWSAAGSYYFSSVCIDDGKLWVLSDTANINTPKTGAGTRPGTDSAWTQISLGHSDDTAKFIGDWSSVAAGTTILVGSWTVSDDEWFICKRQHNKPSGGNAPIADTTNWDLLDNYVGAYGGQGAFHEGAIIKHSGNMYIASDNVTATDPEPDHDDNTKWKRISGFPTQEDFDQLRRDFNSLTHSAYTARGVLVDVLEEPPTITSPAEVWLPRKASRSYVAPAAQVHGDSDYRIGIGDEPGGYKRTQGTINRAKGVMGRKVVEGKSWIGITTRSEDGSPIVVEDMGRWTHSPLGSGIVSVVVQEITSSSFTTHLLMKDNLWIALRAGSTQTGLYLQWWDADGSRQTPIHLTNVGSVNSFNAVNYRHFTGSSTSGHFTTLYTIASTDAERTIEVGISLTENSQGEYLGNREYAWTRQPPETDTDYTPVYSQSMHDIRVMTLADYRAATDLPPRTLILTTST